jgi:predicted Rossmann fold nucleotide-binding protein DprA/Smf involved in DNA uptake
VTKLTPDGQVLVLLCSHLGLSKDDEISPLNLKEWNPFARLIHNSSLKRPEALLGMNAADIQAELDLSPEKSIRLARLLERSGALAIELERLESLGIQVTTRADEAYPVRYKQRLRDAAPTVLFYAGSLDLLGQPGLAVVGSRVLDQAGQECAQFVGNACGLSGLVLYSGGAKGVDTISMRAALEERGTAVGILADSLARAVRSSGYRQALQHGDLCLATPYHPNAGFSVGAAMGRNRLIYSLADYALVVASDAEKGGTWAGATEALKAGWLPVFILEHSSMPEGNRLLLQKGGLSFPFPFTEHYAKLPGWLEEQSKQISKPKPNQLSLF